MCLCSRLQGLEHALERTREEATQFRAQVERLRTERTQLQQRLNDVEARLGDIQVRLFLDQSKAIPLLLFSKTIYLCTHSFQIVTKTFHR